ncbi:hypothetical protein BX600DRAFT_457902 [Xylariales sp. PMI_506]|nr:hypothetical protein BX600DRAFT_457902 [Xylariales sp. PMI_506]
MGREQQGSAWGGGLGQAAQPLDRMPCSCQVQGCRGRGRDKSSWPWHLLAGHNY